MMPLLRDYRRWPATLRGGAVAIGNFDGLHRGHLAVIERLLAVAKAKAVPAIILTFEPHPRHFFQPSQMPIRLQSFAEKARMLRALGIDALLAQRFDASFSQLSAEQFMQQVLMEGLGARHILTGEEFVFGHARIGNAALLSQKAKQSGAFSYEALAPIGNAGEGKFSSSKVREHLRHGEMALASALLGRPYAWTRRVVHGEKRGRMLGFPTANLLPPPLILPRFGVYAVRCDLADGRRLGGVANLGVRPSFGQHAPLCEVHLFSESPLMLYGQHLSIEFAHHLRDERRFENEQALRAQIAIDVAAAKQYVS